MNNIMTDKMVPTLFMEDILALDFTMVKLKIQDADEGLGWSAGECQKTEMEYKRFLGLKRIYPEKDIVPHKMVDAFWHQHILDTQKYAEDCRHIFGYFVHHFPYFGMKDEQDMQNLTNAFEETKVLYYHHFDGSFLGEAPKCKSPKCRTACKPMKCR